MPTLLAPESASACSWLMPGHQKHVQWLVHSGPQALCPSDPRVLCISLVTRLFSVVTFFFFFFYVGRSFISVAIVANLLVRCPQFQRQQKDNPGLSRRMVCFTRVWTLKTCM